jgi:DNA-binding NtrC family response regulator
MEQTSAINTALTKLLDASSRPIYAVDAGRQIVYCNAALAAWLGLEPQRIVGRRVEYHSEMGEIGRPGRDAAAPLADLCPPPRALAGEACSGAVGCVGRDGRLVHRRAQFLPLEVAAPSGTNGASSAAAKPCGVMAFLANHDMRPDELSAELGDEPSGDELHRTIRRFRRARAAENAVETLLGESSAMRRVRSQIDAAAASGASVLIRGPRGSGRAHIGRAIHYGSAEPLGTLTPVDCATMSEESLRWSLESLRGRAPGKETATVLLMNVDRLPVAVQSQLLAELAKPQAGVRFVATMAVCTKGEQPLDFSSPTPSLNPQLAAALSTITIDLPPLAERLEDLPMLAQFFLEAANRDAAKQVGSLRPEALDLLALYSWPAELDELRSVVAAAHAACMTHEIAPADLPAVIHHAAKAAALPRRFVEKIVLEDLLADIEREIVNRAMKQSGGNKSAAADLLGMTRPRLYRRLVQLGLAPDNAEAESQ